MERIYNLTMQKTSELDVGKMVFCKGIMKVWQNKAAIAAVMD